MKRVFLSLLLGIFSVNAPCDELTQLIDKYEDIANIGIWLQDAHSKEVIYTHHGQQRFTPASITKSFTTAASLIALEPDFSYQTHLRADKSLLENTTLKSDLILEFSGDPSLTSTDLNQLLQQLSAQNIKTITGNIIIDNSYFSKPYEARGWVAEDLTWYFGAPAKTVIIDENQMPIEMTMPMTKDVAMVSPKTANTLCQLNVELNPDNNNVYLYGCWPKSDTQKPATLKVALPNPELRAKEIIMDSLVKQGITLQGKIKIGKAAAPDILATHHSPSLATLQAVIMQQSNNIYADSLTKVLGKKYYQRGTLQAGSYAITQILNNKLGLDTSTIRLYDGSGMSTYNQITPQSTAALLQAMYDQVPYKNAYLNMQIVDKTHNFYPRLPENINTTLYLKTGSMSGVSNIAGFIKTKTGKTLIVVSLINQLPQDKTIAREFEQALITYLASL